MDQFCCESWIRARAKRRLRLLRRAPEAGSGLVSELLRRSDQAIHRSPSASLRWAVAALEVTEILPGGAVRRGARQALLAEAWAYVGNALRVLGDLRNADAAIGRALATANRRTRRRGVWARVAHRAGALRRRQQRFDEARELLRSAVATYESTEDSHSAGMALVSLAITEYEAGDPIAAACAITRALRQLSPNLHPRFVLHAAGNLAFYLLEIGRAPDAAECFQAVKRGSGARTPRSVSLRLSWLEAKLAHAAGRRMVAQRLLEHVRRGFIALGLPHETALASLEIALRHAEDGRLAEVADLTAEAYPIFISRDLPAPAMATLLLGC